MSDPAQKEALAYAAGLGRCRGETDDPNAVRHFLAGMAAGRGCPMTDKPKSAEPLSDEERKMYRQRAADPTKCVAQTERAIRVLLLRYEATVKARDERIEYLEADVKRLKSSNYHWNHVIELSRIDTDAREERDDEQLAHIAELEAVLAMTVGRLGGSVEGAPTHRRNFLQRIDALRARESWLESLADKKSAHIAELEAEVERLKDALRFEADMNARQVEAKDTLLRDILKDIEGLRRCSDRQIHFTTEDKIREHLNPKDSQ